MEAIARLSTERARLEAERSHLETERDVLSARKTELEEALASLQAQNAWLRRKVFGTSMSEKHLPLDPNVLEPTLFDTQLPEAEQKKLDEEVRQMEEQNARTIEVAAHRREVRKPVLSGNLPVRESHIYPEGVKDNPDYVEIGTEVTDKVAVIPGQLYIDRTVRHKFVLKSNLQIEDPDRQVFLIAPLPDSVIPKGMAADSLLADIFIGKFVYHLPFYRQIQKYKEMGAVFSDATIGDWFAAVCTNLRPLYDALREEVLQSEYIQVDESTIPVIKEEKPRKAAKEYMWAVRDALGGAVYFHYDRGSRSGETCRKLIGGYAGTMQTDGYEVYDAYENAPGKRLLGCWAHARRKFVEALDEDKTHASEALVYIGKLYRIEDEMREAELDADAIKERRQKESYPIIQEFEKWLDAVSTGMSSKTLIGQAVSYSYVLLPRLSRYVLDGRYNIDNNGIENAIRPLALGRKNYLFAGNHAAAVRAAIAYSFIASCKAAGVDIRTWLVDVLGQIPSYKGPWRNLLPAHWTPAATDSN
jgi:transposase